MLKKIFIFHLLFIPMYLFGSNTNHGGNILHDMTNLVLQLGIIIFIAKAGESLANKLKFPSILGQLLAGILIGPYLLGSISFPGFNEGLFPLLNGSIPITKELYALSTIASILLLFEAGLETNLNLFLSYAFSGTIVGVGGLIISFLVGDLIGILIIENATFFTPQALFLGVISTATSVGVTAMVLSKNRKMDSPEGVTIMSGAVIDDVFGVIILAIVLGISEMKTNNGNHSINWSSISILALKTIVIWLVFTILGLLMASKISEILRKFKNKSTITIMAFGLALLFAGIFEKSGLAMIIGAYVMGLSFSNTDLSYVIQESLHPLEKFFIPLFFTVMGMLVNLKIFFNYEILIFGLIYSIGAILAKVVGSGIPSLFLNFNKIGALRIGFGMAPRSEVALIIAGIGLSAGILNDTIFGICIMMPFITIIFSVPIIGILFNKQASGVRNPVKVENTTSVEFNFQTPYQTKFLLSLILEYFSKEGFFIYRMELDCIIYQIRKDHIFITMNYTPEHIIFKSKHEDVILIKTLVAEAFYTLKNIIKNFEFETSSEQFKNQKITPLDNLNSKLDISHIIDTNSIIMNLNADNKWEAIEELVNYLYLHKKIKDKEQVIKEVTARENIMSTGMQNEFAIPHARTKGVEKVVLALGFHRQGLDFDTLDGKPAKIIVLLISSIHENDPHIQILAKFAQVLYPQGASSDLLNCKTKEEVLSFFKKKP